MKKLLFCISLSLCSVQFSAANQKPVQSSVAQQLDFNDFDNLADEMINQGMAEKIEIKEPSGFQMFLRRAGGPIVMAYVRMREKMSSFWVWLTTSKKKTIHH